MNAHPVSVVGRLRAAEAAFHEAADRRDEYPGEALEKCGVFEGAAIDECPALLAALEKEWDAAHAALATYQDASTIAEGVRYQARQTVERLAPLFESPEKTT